MRLVTGQKLGPGFCFAGMPSRRSGFRVKDAMHKAFAAALRAGGRPGIRATHVSRRAHNAVLLAVRKSVEEEFRRIVRC